MNTNSIFKKDYESAVSETSGKQTNYRIVNDFCTDTLDRKANRYENQQRLAHLSTWRTNRLRSAKTGTSAAILST